MKPGFVNLLKGNFHPRKRIWTQRHVGWSSHDWLRPQKKNLTRRSSNLVHYTCPRLPGYNQWTLSTSISQYLVSVLRFKWSIGVESKSRRRFSWIFFQFDANSFCGSYAEEQNVEIVKCWDGECHIYNLTRKCRRRHKETNLTFIALNECGKLFLYKILTGLWTSGNLSIVKPSFC